MSTHVVSTTWGCPDCGKSRDDVKVFVVTEHDRDVFYHSSACECQCGGRFTIELSFDPVLLAPAAEMAGHPDAVKSVSAISWEDILAQNSPSNPFAIFKRSSEDLEEMIEAQEEAGIWGEPGIFQRMVLMQHFAAFEAYLGDTVSGLARRDSAVMLRLLKDCKELNKVTVDLATAYADPDVIFTKVRTFLADIRWHNFPKADAIYRIALDVPVLPEEEDQRVKLLHAVTVRHDCVHRNGRNTEGNLHGDLTEVIEDVRVAFWQIVDTIQAAVDKVDLARPLVDPYG